MSNDAEEKPLADRVEDLAAETRAIQEQLRLLSEKIRVKEFALGILWDRLMGIREKVIQEMGISENIIRKDL